MPSRSIIPTVNFITLLALSLAGIAQVERPPAGTLVYGGGPYPISIAKTAVDSAGNIYVIGGWIPEIPLNGPQVYSLHDVFVSKIDSSGSIVWLTYLGGRGDNIAEGIAVDSSGNVYGVGFTTSPDFPLQNPIQSSMSTGVSAQTGFIFKLDASGSNPLIDIDNSGNAYIAGSTASTQFPTTPGVLQPTLGGGLPLTPGGGKDVFVSALNPTGTALLFSTYFGGTGDDVPAGLAIDSNGNIFLSGTTTSPDFRDS